jgi:mRNA interferase RelE/StbE
MSDSTRRYIVEFEPAAQRQLGKLPRHAQAPVAALIDALATEPRPPGMIVLKGQWRGYYRVRSGDYRVVYDIEDDVLRVLVVKIGDRKEVY